MAEVMLSEANWLGLVIPHWCTPAEILEQLYIVREFC
ncbi:MAG: hypothetical protein ACI85I_001346 [Arenicella sp.]